MGQTTIWYISLEHETIIMLREVLTWEEGNIWEGKNSDGRFFEIPI